MARTEEKYSIMERMQQRQKALRKVMRKIRAGFSFLMEGTIARFLVAIVVFILYRILYNAFQSNSALADSYAGITRITSLLLSGAMSFVKVSVAEILLYVLITAFLLYLCISIVWMITRGDAVARIVRIVSNIAAWTSCAVFAFFLLYGANYFCTPIAQQLELNVQERSVSELKAATEEILTHANELSQIVPRDGDGFCQFGTFSDMTKKIPEAYANAGKNYSFLQTSYAETKQVSAWKMLSRFGIAGIYVPFTGEALVNPDTPAPAILFHMAHETAHRLSIAPEDEANFVAYLVCRDDEDRRVRYSAYFMAYRYCLNALYAAAPEAAAELNSQVSEQMRVDLTQLNENIRQYDGVLRDAGTAVNDSYLKGLQQEDGVNSYGMVVDLILAEYASRHE